MPRPGALTLRDPAAALGAAMLSGKLPDGSRASLPVTSELAEAAAAGVIRTYGTGVLTSAVAGNVRITIHNLSATVPLVLVGLSVASTVTAFGTLRLAPTTGLPADNALPGVNHIAGGGFPALGDVRADVSATTALGGGTDTGVVIACGANAADEVILPAPLIIPPGMVLGVGADLGAAFTFGANITLLEG